MIYYQHEDNHGYLLFIYIYQAVVA